MKFVSGVDDRIIKVGDLVMQTAIHYLRHSDTRIGRHFAQILEKYKNEQEPNFIATDSYFQLL